MVLRRNLKKQRDGYYAGVLKRIMDRVRIMDRGKEQSCLREQLFGQMKLKELKSQTGHINVD